MMKVTMMVTVAEEIPVNRGRGRGAGAGVTEARGAPTTNTNPQSIWSLFGFAYDGPTLNYQLSVHHSSCMAQE